MRVTVIGAGYVGQVVGVCLTTLGHSVTTYDVDTHKIRSLQRGEPTIYEDGLQALLRQAKTHGTASFTADLKDCFPADAVFLCVGTPPNEDGAVDLTYLEQAAQDIKPHLEDEVVIIKSTVPPGTAQRISNELGRDVLNNPEFLREGTAVQDFLHADRVVIGAPNTSYEEFVEELYADLLERSTLLYTNNAAAELIKYASNAFLATKISYINELSRLAERIGADINDVAKGMGLDARISPAFFGAGVGYGGSCFPKDVDGITRYADQLGVDLGIIKATQRANNAQVENAVQKIRDALGALNDKKVAVWGLSFKAGTDDIRGAPSTKIIRALLSSNASVAVYDPEATQNTKNVFGDTITYTETPENAATNADAVMVLTDWDEFKTINLDTLSFEGVLYDGRNIYEHRNPENIEVIGVGKPRRNNCEYTSSVLQRGH